MLDFDLAQMYGTETAQLKRTIRRNKKRFDGEDFMFEVTRDELSKCQIGTLNKGRGSNIKYLPFAFTELGVAILSSVLNSETAIEINKGIMRAAVMIQMTWPGAPTLYYGDEAGLCGWTDPDNRRTYPWGREDQNLIQYHRDIIAIHKEEEALMKGSLKYLYGGFKVLGYGRFTDTEKMVVLINSGFDEARVKVSVWEVGVTDDEEMVEVIMSNEEGYTMEKKVHPVTSGVLDITLPRVSAILLKAVEIEK